MRALPAEERIRALPIWSSAPSIRPVEGGITNVNFRVEDSRGRFFVRLGDDIAVHGVMRFNERAVSVAAAACGLSPAVRWSAPGVLVLDWIEARPLGTEDFRSAGTVTQVAALLRDCHARVEPHLRGPILAFPMFHVLRDYLATLRAGDGRHRALFARFEAEADSLRAAVGDGPTRLCHNDLLPANILDDGARLWLIDWDYAGFGDPGFDVANIATNGNLDDAGTAALLEAYSGAQPDPTARRRHSALGCVSLLRETLWGMVSEEHSALPIDFAGYTARGLRLYDAAFARFRGEAA